MKTKVIYNEVYQMNFSLVISESRDEVFKKYGIEWNEVGGCCELPVDGLYHIFIMINPKSPLDVLVHECDHAVSELWRIRGIEKLEGMDECYAYMLAWIFRECNKELSKPTKK